ncbi:MAG: GNAT family N-acetyltransferase [Lachnospiraceae bacterium]|nr:GNAT family N-acetyltransferase [Lachnospiraceae bacterium]
MMIVLVKLSNTYRTHLNEMMDEWSLANEKIVPYAIRRIDYKEFEKYLRGLEEEERGIPGLVPATTYFGLDTEQDIFVGAVNIRHYLNESLLLNGGHIGDGIRPSQRRKGYATKMISLALEECRKLGIDRVLMVCDKNNIGSAKSIISNGGVLENEIEVNGNMEQRYWIVL